MILSWFWPYFWLMFVWLSAYFLIWFFAQFLVQSSGAFFVIFIFCILYLFFSISFLPHSGLYSWPHYWLLFVCFLHNFWCNFLVPLLAWFFVFCIYFAFSSYSRSSFLELSWAFPFDVCPMGFMFGHLFAQITQTLCRMMFAIFI